MTEPPAAGAEGVGLRGRRAEARLLACVHCGFCLPACPTYEVLGDENDSPRGRLYLMRAFAEGRIDAGGALALHLGRCLGCWACEPVCPAGVEFGALLETAREEIRRAGPAAGRRARRLAGLVLAAATGGTVSRLLYALGRAVRPLVPRRPSAGRPGRTALALRLLAATRPADLPRAPGRTGAARPARPGAGGAGPGPTVARLEGCVMRGLFPHVQAAARRTLRAAGYREVAAPGQRCCGALHAHAGRAPRARRLARANIVAFERSGARWVAADSAGCGAALREYPRWLEADPDWAERARRLSARVRDVSELLAEPPRPLRGRLAGRAAYDDPCHLLHAQGVADAPLRMLAGVEGLEVRRLPSSERCCGGAGIFNLLEPELAWRIAAGKAEEARAAGCDRLLTGNPGCIMQLGAAFVAAGVDMPVIHPVELLDAALEHRALGGVPAGAGRGDPERADRHEEEPKWS